MPPGQAARILPLRQFLEGTLAARTYYNFVMDLISPVSIKTRLQNALACRTSARMVLSGG